MFKDIVRNGDVVSGAVLAALGVYVFVEASGWAYYSEDGPGPAFFPVWYGVALFVLSLGLIAMAVHREIYKADKAVEAIDWRAIGRALGTWLAFAVCVGLMGWLGFLVSFALLTIFMIVVVFRESALKAVLVAIAASAGFWLIFPFALGVELPIGVFGF